MLLLCAGAVASLAGVWALAGLSERSPLRVTPRVAIATLIGLGIVAVLYGRAPRELRSELALPLLFGAASLLALAVGAAKLDAALADKNGPRAVRRASGLVAGAVLGMGAVGAASLDLSASSLVHARFGWGFMFAVVVGSLIVFSGRAQYAGAGLVALGQRAFVLALVALALLAGAQLTVAAPAPPITPAPDPAVAVPSETAPVAADSDTAAPSAAAPSAAVPAASGDAAAPPAPTLAPTPASPSADSASSAAAPSAAPAPGSAPPGSAATSSTGRIEIGEVTTRGLLEADARGAIEYRKDRFEACLADAKNDQHGSLTFKVGVDRSGSVAYIKPTEGDLKGTPLADCLLRVFYKMGFAAPPSDTASFHVTLRVP